MLRVRVDEVVAHLNHLWSVGQEAEDPPVQKVVQSEVSQLVSQPGGNYGVEC